MVAASILYIYVRLLKLHEATAAVVPKKTEAYLYIIMCLACFIPLACYMAVLFTVLAKEISRNLFLTHHEPELL